MKTSITHWISLTGLLACLSAFATPAWAAQTNTAEKTTSASQTTSASLAPAATPRSDLRPPAHRDPSITHHSIELPDHRTLRYTATAGTLPLLNDQESTEALVFYVSYTLDDAPSTRPLMFAFNGGPGSSSVWLHLGMMGPRVVQLPETVTAAPRPPFTVEDNPATWLEYTDLVFIDPVGTGYSRAAKPELTKKFHTLSGDIASMGEFIRLYLSRNERWLSPLFLAGESYGTTRAAGLSAYLLERGIALNGIVLVSTIINFGTESFDTGNDLPYLLFLPTYTATAWYHKKLPADLQSQGLERTVAEAEQWSMTEYAAALLKGTRLSPEQRNSTLDKLQRYTGLSREYLDRADLRVKGPNFSKELLQSQNRVVGRMDTRYVAPDASPLRPTPDFDPSLSWMRAPFTAALNSYVRQELGYRSDLHYYILGEGVSGWDFGAQNGYADTSEALRDAMAQNPNMRVFVAQGYYDLATPFAATNYSLNHMNLDPSLQGNIKIQRYESGHMPYLDKQLLEPVKSDVAAFVKEATAQQ